MTGIKGYVAVVGEAVRNLLRPNITVKYPAEHVETPEGFRGAPTVDVDKCILCNACMRQCPTHCIDIRPAEDMPEDPEKGIPYKFDILIAQCMFCQTCEEFCPIGRKGRAAIYLDKNDWRNAVFNTDDSLRTFIVYKKSRKKTEE